MPLEFPNPCLGPGEGVSVGDVVDDDGSLGASVVHRCQRVVALLAGRVPDLELDCRVVQTNGLRQEGRADRRLLELVELAFDEPQHQRRLADRRLAQKNQLELGQAGGRTPGPRVPRLL